MNKDVLDKILNNHKLWLKTNGEEGERANLQEADLRWANLQEADLRWADLQGADLRKADLRWTNLRWADLQGADLRKADLRWTNLRWTNLRWANLQEADLRWADLQGADLQEADLRWANLQGADLRWANLQGADLRWADLQGADLDYSSLPLSCKGLNIHIDNRLAIQQLYHLVRNVQFSKNTSSEMKELCKLKSIVEKANEFHRVEECGRIEIDHPTEKGGTK